MATRVELDWIESMSVILDRKIKWIEVEAMSKPGENYASVLTRATLGYRDGDKDERFSVVLKAPLDHVNQQVGSSLRQYLQNEIMMYQEIFQVYSGLLKMNQPFEKMWPQCYVLNSSNIFVLEDLKASGYELPRQLGKMSHEHILLVMESLGRFHALSIAAMEKQLINPKQDSRFVLFFTEVGLGDNFVLTGIKSVADAIAQTWPSDWKPISEKLLSIRNKVMSELRSLEAEETRVKVVNHGDPWCRNMMFKYDNDIPTSVRLVDFQNPHFNSFGFEIAHFLTASCITPDEYTNDTRFLKKYCDNFTSCLIDLGLDPKLGPTVEEALAELERLQLFRLVVLSTVTPLSMFTTDDPWCVS